MPVAWLRPRVRIAPAVQAASRPRKGIIAPNLEHLKKQAKALLDQLRHQNPDSILADALHAVAREYGFETWPALKALVESLPGADRQNPFVGRWEANLSKSERHPLNQFQSATIQFAVDGDTVTITDIVVDDAGQELRGSNTIQADGVAHTSEHGYVLIATWRGPHVLETVATQHGEVVGRGSYEVSADRKTLTISAPEQVIVLDRC